MTVKLLILDGKESGVEISLDQQKIFSIGTINDSDFYLTKNKEDFNVFFNALSDEKAEWWSNKKITVTRGNGETVELSAKKIELGLNETLSIGGRTIGLYSDPSKASQALASAQPAEEDTPEDNSAAFAAPEPEIEAPTQKAPQPTPATTKENAAFDEERTQSFSALDDEKTPVASKSNSNSFIDEPTTPKSNKSSADDFMVDLTPPEGSDARSTSAIRRQELRLEEDDVYPHPNTDRTPRGKRKEKKKSGMYYAVRIFPFAIGALLLGVYTTSQYRTTMKPMPTVSEQEKDDRNASSNTDDPNYVASNSSGNSTAYNGDSDFQYDTENQNYGDRMQAAQNNSSSSSSSSGPSSSGVPHYRDDNGHGAAPFENPQSENDRFIASGAEYKTGSSTGTGKWGTVNEASPSSENELEVLRENIAKNDFDLDETKEILFPDEKMMAMIRDMLETAGADGIDVRFDRGNYDVFGYVMDDAKWSRIYKILTFDLDLSKVKFSVETSVSLINKFEELLKKFNLSNYVVLSLGNNGQIFAKTYYPPAMEGLWLTIKTKFEQKYGDYTKVNEYRAHLGWINIVKVSFDQPSYVLLGDGRRIVEGSVIGGDSVLDAILEDSIRVKSSASQLRYYLINKSTRQANADLSQR